MGREFQDYPQCTSCDIYLHVTVCSGVSHTAQVLTSATDMHTVTAASVLVCS